MLRIVAGGLRVLVDTAVGITVPDPRGPEGHVSPPSRRGRTGPDPLKNHKATKPTFNVVPLSARQRNAI